MGMPLSMALCRISQSSQEFLYKADKGYNSKIVNFLTQESRKSTIYTLSASNLCIHDSRAYTKEGREGATFLTLLTSWLRRQSRRSQLVRENLGETPRGR